MKASGQPDLIVAGGVFANVRLNQECEELDSVRSMFIHPGMGDEGLAYGAACVGASDARSRRSFCGDASDRG